MNHGIIRILRTAFIASAIAVSSCPNPVRAAGTQDVADERSRLQLAEPPEGAEPVLTVQRRLSAAKSQAERPKTQEVVITGQIGGVPNIWPETHPQFPWYAGQASFFLVDSKVAAQFAGHTKGHAGTECVYCKNLAAKNVNAIAVVNLVDERGEILRVDVRKLLALKENQTITVRGKAKLLAGRMLVIDADGIYAR